MQSGATERRMKGGNIEDRVGKLRGPRTGDAKPLAPQDEHCSQDSNAPGTLSMANSGQPNTGWMVVGWWLRFLSTKSR